MSRQYDKLFSDLLGFIQGAHKQLEILHENDIAGRKNDGDSTSITFLPARLEIPTAALIAGEGGLGSIPSAALIVGRGLGSISAALIVGRGTGVNTLCSTDCW